MFYLTPYIHLSNSRCISLHTAALTDTQTVSYRRKEGGKEGKKKGRKEGNVLFNPIRPSVELKMYIITYSYTD